SLSIYPLGKGIDVDAERNVFQELAGDPTVDPFHGDLSVFHDQEHLTRSSRDLTLIQLSEFTLRDAVDAGEFYGPVYWAVPTILSKRAGYDLDVLSGGAPLHGFVDGGGSTGSYTIDLGPGPGSGATDQRTPELGADVRIVRNSKISMLNALRQVETAYGKT